MTIARTALLTAALVALASSHATGQPATQPGDDALIEEHEGDTPVPAAAADGLEPTAEGHVVAYGTAGERALHGYLALPEGDPSTAPALVVIHEWWGLNENIRTMAERLADAGYIALAIDLYNGQVGESPDQAMALMSAARDDAETTSANLLAAVNHVATLNGGGRTGVIGWCFGGGMALRATIENPNLVTATVIYYGQLVTDAGALAAIEAPVLGIFGSDDGHITPELVREFEQVMNELGKSVEVHIYEGADHAFANPSGQRYNAEAATDAWTRTLAFFGQHLMPAE